MKSMLIMVLAASLAFLPYAAPVKAQDTSSGRPPIEQPLVSEGQFAVELASALGLTSTNDEAAAEDSLARVRIAPRNGWITDYPMTPDIIEEVRQSASKAASAGALNMSEADAARTVSDVSSAMNLPVTQSGKYPQPSYNSYSTNPENQSSPGSTPPGPPGYASSDQYVPPADVEGYYSEYGPPVVTYYPPPWEYQYLYDWVPYPFWWGGFFFGGFYMLSDFGCWGGYYNNYAYAYGWGGPYRHPYHHYGHGKGGPFDHHHHHYGQGKGGRGHWITNHVNGPNGVVTRIAPATRFSTFSGAGRSSNISRFNSAGARAGARTILNHADSGGSVAATRNPGGFRGSPAGKAGGAYPRGAFSGAHGFTGTQSRPAYVGGHSFGGASPSHSFSRGAFSGGHAGGFRGGSGGHSGGFGGHGGGFGGHGGGFGGHGGGFGGHGGGGGHR